MTPEELEQQTTRQLDQLARQLGGAVARDRLLALGRCHFGRLRRDATVFDYIPLLVYRCTREDLIAPSEEHLYDAA